MRAGRLVNLLMLLQREGRMTAAALARELEVCERTVMRDVEELSSVGVPVYATRGPGGGFELLEGYRSELQAPPGWRAAGRRAPSRRRGVVRISPEGRRVAAVLGNIQPLRVRRAIAADERGWLEATFPIDSVEAAVIELLAMTPHVEVLAPAQLREAVMGRLRSGLSLHADPSTPGA